MAGEKILVIDDEEKILSLVSSYLEKEGYQIHTALDGISGLEKTREIKPDIIVLDIMLPGLDGLEVLARLRRESNVYVILLTAKTEETDKIVGLSVGADDYVTKPFSPRELTARVRAVLRRLEKATVERDILRAGDITLDRAGRTVTLKDAFIDLTPSEFDILAVLMAAPGRAFTRLELLERIQGAAYEGYERTIDVHIRNLRAKIDTDRSIPRYIETVYGTGYRLAPGL